MAVVAAVYMVSPGTATQALGVLVDEGLLLAHVSYAVADVSALMRDDPDWTTGPAPP